MCTLSYFPTKQGEFIFTFSRDESPKRSSTEVINDAEKALIYPKDATLGGTWLTLDGAKNRVTCLLNGAFERHERTPPYRLSRGKMVLESLDFEHIEDFFEDYTFGGIEPFTMVVFEHFKLYEMRWDGTKRHISWLPKMQPRLWSSCTLYDKNIRGQRQTWFDDFLLKNTPDHLITPQSLWQLHEKGGQHDPENAFFMRRSSGVETVSLSQINFSENNLNVKFYEHRNNIVHHASLQPIA